jgi:uncharacterized membrane protein YeaQ/YmgE (transglycosylase-associated protein family)
VDTLVNVIVWIGIGVVIGLLGSIALRTEAERGTMINIVVGVSGALAAELVLTRWFGVQGLNRTDYGLPALAGAIGLLTVFTAFRSLAQRYRPGE